MSAEVEVVPKVVPNLNKLACQHGGFRGEKKVIEPSIKVWRDRLSVRNEKTAVTYTSAVRVALEELNTTAEELVCKLKSHEWNIYDKFGELLSVIKDKAPCTVISEVNALRQFLEFNDIEISEKKFRVKVMMPRNYIATEDRIPTGDELISMYNTATPKGRVIILLGVHGLRIGEISNLRVRDLRLSDQLPHLLVRAETAKEKKARLVPLTPQAVEVLSSYIRNMNTNDKVVGRSTRAIAGIVNRVTDKVGMIARDERTNFRLVHVHCLRKYAKTMMAKAGVSESITAMILGHRKYLDENYLRADSQMIKDEFAKAIPYLTIGATVTSNVKLEEKLARMEVKIEATKKIVSQILRCGNEVSVDLINQLFTD